MYLHVNDRNIQIAFEHAVQRAAVITSLSAYTCAAQVQQRTCRQSCCRRAR